VNRIDLALLPADQYATVGPLAVRLGFWERFGTAEQSLQDWIASLIRHHLRSGPARYLDVGCGDGRLFRGIGHEFAPGSTRVALDRSLAMVSTACLGSPMPANCSVLQADVQRLPFADASFDAVTCTHVLHHVPDIRAAVRELARVTGPDGVVVVTTGDFDPASKLNRIHYEMLHSLSFPPFAIDTSQYTRFAPGVAHSILVSEFASVRHVLYRNDAVCTEPDELMAYYRSGMMYRQTEGRGDPRIQSERWDQLEAAVRSHIDAAIARSGSLVVEGTVHGFICVAAPGIDGEVVAPTSGVRR
jgi:SAM-dependent methyltransferase